MRLKSEIWAKAFLRRCAAEGAVAVVVRRGDPDAGTIYIKINRLDGMVALFGPAPAGLAEANHERRWARCFASDWAPEMQAEAYLRREINVDPDVWILEVEDGRGRHFLDGWL
jgi:hypothetical protein